jgi:hypothetical protein
MRTIERIDQWLADGRLSPTQHQAIAPLLLRRRISVFAELNVALYLGVLAFATGLAWTATTYSTAWGDAAILGPATLAMGACFYYCVSRMPRYANTRVQSPTLAFDYVLYLGCLIFGTELAYIEYRFGILRSQWDVWLLLSSVLYVLLAYSFDNRFVLSLGIATLGGWFGVRLSHAGFVLIDAVRTSALGYAAVLVAAGTALHARDIKRHFLETYLHVAGNVALAALVSGVFDDGHPVRWLIVLLVLCSVVIAAGTHFRRFASVVYGTLYGYVGISRELLRHLHGDTETLTYLTMSATAVIIGLVMLARRTGSNE